MNLELLTDRLRMTPLVEADVDIAIAIWTNPDVVRFICDAATEDKIRAEMSESTRRGSNGCIGIWCVADRLSGEKIGSVYLLPMPVKNDKMDYSLLVPGRLPDGEIELGYFLIPSAWGNGYATEIAMRLLEFAFQESPLTELVASVNDNNLASHNVLRKTGFTESGRAICWGEDTPIYRITRDEWTDFAG